MGLLKDNKVSKLGEDGLHGPLAVALMPNIICPFYYHDYHMYHNVVTRLVGVNMLKFSISPTCDHWMGTPLLWQ